MLLPTTMSPPTFKGGRTHPILEGRASPRHVSKARPRQCATHHGVATGEQVARGFHDWGTQTMEERVRSRPQREQDSAVLIAEVDIALSLRRSDEGAGERGACDIRGGANGVQFAC